MRRPAIPPVPRLLDERQRFDASLKERLEQIAGERGGIVRPLPADAALPAVVAKINEIIELLQ